MIQWTSLQRLMSKNALRKNVNTNLLDYGANIFTLDWRNQTIKCMKKKALWTTLTWKYFQILERTPQFAIPSPQDIDWEHLRLAINRLPLGLKRWFNKFATGCIGNRYKLHQWGDGSAKCPNCPHPVEKSSYVFLCNNSKTISNFNSNMKQLETILSETKTLPSLQTAILKILTIRDTVKPSTSANLLMNME